MKHHPLYGQLSQLDDGIAAINLAAAAPRVPLSASQIATQTADLNRELRDAQTRANKILAQKQNGLRRARTPGGRRRAGGGRHQSAAVSTRPRR